MAMPRRSLRPGNSSYLKENNLTNVNSKKEKISQIEEDEDQLSEEECDLNEGFDETDRVTITSSPLSSCSPKSNRSWSSCADSFETASVEVEPKKRSRGAQKNLKFTPPIDENRSLKKLQIRNKIDVNRNLDRQNRYGATRVILIGAIFIFILISTTLYWKIFQKTESMKVGDEKTLEAIYSELKNGLKILKQDFKQTKHLWIQLISAFQSIMESEPQHPSVVLTLVPHDSIKTSVCLIHKIAQIAWDAFEDSRRILIDVESLMMSSDSIKKYLYNLFNDLDKSHVAIVHNIEKIPGDAAMIFHSFCDTENAPHKRVLYFLTLGVSSNYSTMAVNDFSLDNTIDDYLNDIWIPPIRDVDVASILTRIANSPIVVKPESPEILQQYCTI